MNRSAVDRLRMEDTFSEVRVKIRCVSSARRGG